MKKLLTTGQVAEICGVSPMTVKKWLQSGQLDGFVLPGSKHRRILKSNLVKFMRENNIPVPDDLVENVG